MGIKTVRDPPNSPDLAPCDFCLFPKLRVCRYKTIGEMKEAMTKVIDMPIQEDFYEASQMLFERCNKCIVAGGNYFERDKSFMCVLSIQVPIRKKSGNLFNEPRIYVCICKPTKTAYRSGVLIWAIQFNEFHLEYCNSVAYSIGNCFILWDLCLQ